nr:MAG: hypothetical protein EDM05_30230 [Leptolyngbya sp. IPPAS B-1204]
MRSLKKTKVDLLLEVLADGDWHWGDELAKKVGRRFDRKCSVSSLPITGDELAKKVGRRFGATIKQARDKRYSIETERDGMKHRYRLLRF